MLIASPKLTTGVEEVVKKMFCHLCSRFSSYDPYTLLTDNKIPVYVFTTG